MDLFYSSAFSILLKLLDLKDRLCPRIVYLVLHFAALRFFQVYFAVLKSAMHYVNFFFSGYEEALMVNRLLLLKGQRYQFVS